MKKILFLLFIGASLSANACLNEYGFSLEGERIGTRYFYLRPRDRAFDKGSLEKQAESLRAKLESDTTFHSASDLSVVLMKLGRVDQALTILEELIVEHPREYNIVANLGTAYELSGQLEKALELIKLGYDINPKSHRGSEWVHIRILEAKIKDRDEPGWLERNPIISMDEMLARLGPKKRHEHRESAIAIQVKTRLPFTPAPNRVIANLLEQFAKYHQEHRTYENALLGYIYAMEFHTSQEKKDEMRQNIRALRGQRASSNLQYPHQFERLFGRYIDDKWLFGQMEEVAEELHIQDSVHAHTGTLPDHEVPKDSIPESEISNGVKVIEEKDSQTWVYWLLGGLGAIAVLALVFRASRKGS